MLERSRGVLVYEGVLNRWRGNRKLYTSLFLFVSFPIHISRHVRIQSGNAYVHQALPAPDSKFEGRGFYDQRFHTIFRITVTLDSVGLTCNLSDKLHVPRGGLGIGCAETLVVPGVGVVSFP